MKSFIVNQASMIWIRNTFTALLALAFFQIAYYYPQMPEVMASHFGGSGAPDDWAGRTGFFALYAAILLMLAVIFLYVPKWSENRSRFKMNMPNREYWLAPERREQTLHFFQRQMLIMGIIHLVLTLLVMQMVIQANLDSNPVLDQRVFWLLIIYSIILFCWLANFFYRFRKPR